MRPDKSKCDPDLGRQVEEVLKGKGFATPTTELLSVPDDEKIAKLTKLNAEMMEILGLDLTDASLIDTPRRIAKMHVKENFWGMQTEFFPKCTTIPNEGVGYQGMVVENDIKVMSSCEHHFVVIDGYAHVAYIPDKLVLGLSKMNRIVEYFSRRPQVQERLGNQIHSALCHILQTEDVAVQISAVHYCVKSRGIEDQNSFTTTNVLTGAFRTQPETRQEFMQMAMATMSRGR